MDNNTFIHIDYEQFSYSVIIYTCRVDLTYKENK